MQPRRWTHGQEQERHTHTTRTTVWCSEWAQPQHTAWRGVTSHHAAHIIDCPLLPHASRQHIGSTCTRKHDDVCSISKYGCIHMAPSERGENTDVYVKNPHCRTRQRHEMDITDKEARSPSRLTLHGKKSMTLA